MKLDKVFTVPVDRTLGAGGSGTFNFSRGKINGLIISGMSYIGANDRVTVKLRQNNKVLLLVSRMRMTDLEFISNLNYGYAYSPFNEIVYETVKTAGEGARLGGVVRGRTMYIDLGHITLDQGELEITLDGADHATLTHTDNFSFYSVHFGDQPDRVFIYDETKDLYGNHDSVRSIFIKNETGFADVDGDIDKDVDVQVDSDEKSFFSDITGVIAATQLFSNVENLIADKMVKIFAKSDGLPADCHIKVTGNDASETALIFIKEEIMQAATTKSTFNNLGELIQRVEKLERKDPAKAKAYRHAGIIEKSQDLKKVKEVIEDGSDSDQ